MTTGFAQPASDPIRADDGALRLPILGAVRLQGLLGALG